MLKLIVTYSLKHITYQERVRELGLLSLKKKCGGGLQREHKRSLPVPMGRFARRWSQALSRYA